jgi:spermidine synthase
LTEARAGARLLAAVGLVSAAVLGFEISLMRMLLVASWHHFAFLVISVALLGFGASGTVLLAGRARALRAGEPLLFALIVAAGVAMPISAGLVQRIPVEARLAPAGLAGQVGWWIAYWAVLTVPFLLGACAIGLALMLAPRRSGVVYGANLIGSAAGALLAPAAMRALPPELLPAAAGLVAFGGAAVLVTSPRRAGALVACAAAAALWLHVDRPHIRMDPFKYGAHIQRLMDQGSVYRNGVRYGPRATVAGYSGGVLHDLPFLAPGRTPPPLSVLVADGHLAGSVLNVASPEAAAVVDGMLMAFAHALAAPTGRVALLGETGGVDVWLAIRRGATEVHVVQPDANVPALLRQSMAAVGGGFIDRPEVRLHVADPRHFVEHAPGPFDLVQLVGLESSAAGSGGIGGLGQDYLVTVQGLAACLDCAGPDGVVTVTRGIQTPPRDNVKLLATIVEALRRRGVTAPRHHVVIVRDFLAVCTVVRRSPWSPADLARAEALCRAMQLTPVWIEGLDPGALNRPDALEPAPDGVGDLYHYAARRLFAEDRDAFIDGWRWDVRPPTDDRPYFGDFCRLASLRALRDAYGDAWLARTEAAFLFVLAAIAIVGLAGAAATLGPLPLLAGAPRGGRRATAVYFGGLGLGYLLLEMTWLSRMTLLVGDPVQAAAVTISGFLLFSGLGSLASQRLGAHPIATVRRAIVAVLVLGLVETAVLPSLATGLGGLPTWARFSAALLLIAPPAVAMGFPMPMGLRRLDGGPLVPWAWGTNGFASVLAAPLAVATAMTWGYHVVAGLALCAYAVAGLGFARLPAAR